MLMGISKTDLRNLQWWTESKNNTKVKIHRKGNSLVVQW